MKTTLTLSLAAFAVWAGFAATPPAATGKMLALSPGKTGDFTWVKNPTHADVARLRANGKKPLVEDHAFADELPALTNWAETACAVAFDRLPRRHLIQSWRQLGVTVLKTVPFDVDRTADRFRRECSFLAFQAGADGVWLPDAEKLPAPYKQALDEANEDWRILKYLRALADLAAQHEDGNIRIEQRRADYFIVWSDLDRENLDTLRLECVGYAKRLEQLLGLPEAKLPVTCAKPIAPQRGDEKPYADWPERPKQYKIKGLGSSVDLGEGLSFSADNRGFSITFSHTNGPALKQWATPGGQLEFRLYVLGKDGTYLPYRYHCDLDPMWYGPRAPARSRSGFLFATDERFRPFAIAYGVGNPRVWSWPRLQDYGPDYPPLNANLNYGGNKQGGWYARVSFGWAGLYGHWPMMRDGKLDVWYVGLDKSPLTGKPLAARVLWPKGHKDNFRKFASSISTGEMTGIYKGQLDRTFETYFTSFRERFYPFAKTAKPAFYRYDYESDTMFLNRLVKPLTDANENAWQCVWTDKEHKHPRFPKESDAVKMSIWKNLGRMFYMMDEVSVRRRDYLVGRYAGREPPEYVKKEDHSKVKPPDDPDVDYDANEIQLDDKEF